MYLKVFLQSKSFLGKTNLIMVDRCNILATGMDEISAIDNKFLTFEVQFYDEYEDFDIFYIKFLLISFHFY